MDVEVPMERLEAEITTLAAHLAAAMCRWLLLVAEFDRRKGWETWECRSAAHWLSWKCGIDSRTARDHLRVGTALGPLPLVTGAFERGELSYSQVRAISRIATSETEEGLVQLARHSTAAQLERVVRAARKVLDLDEVNDRHGRRALSRTHDDDGSVVLSVRLSPEDAELAKVTIDAFTENLPHDPGSAEPHSARAVDGFLDMIRAARAAEPVAGDTTDRATVVLVDDPDGTRLADGTPLHPETAKRLACDSSVIAMYIRDGEPLDVGRKTPTPNRAMRRALARRDLTCRFPGCDATRFLHAHHLDHWGHGGPTRVTNLLLLCPFHHRLHHEGGYTVTLDALGRFEFHRPDGTLLAIEALHATGPDLAHRNHQLGLSIDHKTLPIEMGRRTPRPLPCRRHRPRHRPGSAEPTRQRRIAVSGVGPNNVDRPISRRGNASTMDRDVPQSVTAADLAAASRRVGERVGWDFGQVRTERDPVPWDYEPIVCEVARQAERVLDIGTGGGEKLSSLLAECAWTSVVAIDHNPTMIATARDRLGDAVGLMVGDATALPVAARSCDVVLDRHAGVSPAEVARVLRPGGRFVTQQVGFRNTQSIFDAFGWGSNWELLVVHKP